MTVNAGNIQYTVDIRISETIRSQQELENGFDRLQNSMSRTDRSARALGGGLNKLAASIAAVVSAAALKSMAGLVQSYQEMAERVKMATSSQEEYEMVQQRLLATANGTYRSMAEAQELYIRTADALRSMGYSTSQALDVTDSMSYAFVTNATSAERANAAISALSKSINTGKVAADQWETITSAIPSVINDIASASGKTSAEVRALGAAGKLTAKDLSEGLRQSLDATATAAAGMSNNLRDASVRATTALQVMLVELEKNTGALDKLTNGIIDAADAVINFAGDADKMTAFLAGVEGAAIAVGAAITGKVIVSMGAWTVAQYAAIQAIRARISADSIALNGAVRRASIEKTAAAAALQTAQAEFLAARNTGAHALAQDALNSAQARYATAATAAAAAQHAANNAMRAGTVIAGGLRTAMAFLAGPAGLILLAASAFLVMGANADTAATGTDRLARSIEGLTSAQKDLLKSQLEKDILKETAAMEKRAAQIELNEKLIARGGRGTELYRQNLLELKAAYDTSAQSISAYQKKIEDLNKVKPKDSGEDTDLPEDKKSSEGQKRLKAMRDELALLKVTGEARARLAALQRLGAAATPGERKEAERLATEIYRLEEAQRAAAKTTKGLTDAQKDAKRAAEELAAARQSDTDTLNTALIKLAQTKMSVDELADSNARLALSKYASEEQIAQLASLNRELEKADELQKRKEKFGTTESDIAGYIRGDVTPLSGGKFDDQTARYEAEAAAEELRYKAQLDRLKEAKELKIEVEGGYYALEEQYYSEHIARMNQIEEARNSVMLESAEAGFGSMADIMKTAFGEQSAAYKVMFAASKAFAIAQASVAIGQGIAQAAANPWPLNLAAIASVAAATASMVSNIQSVNLAVSGRQQGGPVQANGMYRINESGAPEVFNAANGRQYMLPNQRGDVVSNREATQNSNSESSYNGGQVNVTQNIIVQGRVDNYTARQLATQASRRQQITQARFGR